MPKAGDVTAEEASRHAWVTVHRSQLPPELPMTRFAVAYVVTLAVFCGLDFLWLGFVAKGYYQSQLGGLLLDKPNIPVAALFYALYVAGVLVFAVLPALDAGQWSRALLHGALFGFFAYATYDLTNLATLKGWTPSVALLDLAWGTVVTGVSATAGCLVTRSAF
jgi:uncharacterized membrane protein